MYPKLEYFRRIRRLTPDEQVNLYHRLYNQIKKESGYQPFGFDWITLKLTRPQISDTMRYIYKLAQIRQQRAIKNYLKERQK